MIYINSSGRAGNLAQKIEQDLRSQRGNGPEDTIRAKVVDVVTAALHGFEPNTEVNVSVTGALNNIGGGRPTLSDLTIKLTESQGWQGRQNPQQGYQNT